MRKCICTIIFVMVSFSSKHLFAKDVIYAAKEQNVYYTKLLSHALSYTPEKNYRVKRYGLALPKQRAFNLLAQGSDIDVMNGSSTTSREKTYQAIYFPILRGLKGWRLAIINQNNPDLFKNIKTEQEFKNKIPVQFHTWTATKIFEHNKIKVAKGTNFKGLFQMLHKKRIDYLPRSFLEVKRDLTLYPELNLMIDPYILIKYPSAYYFYVSKNNIELANDIKIGLEKALADGSFEKLFNQAFGSEMASFKLQARKVFNLDNPYIPTTIPVNRKELWAKAN
ncbi:transporter substrate-binding domain-containing protein [Paraglaciecola aquimarina]|uniref:Transporter substrate-binding domain-containing protein n=1 Tax=Paraglaciecola algarum TaxID=3050085 RepID=A0ABS9D205_9ALTE|nr:transporter substrate-binding domain-containing protein [Paraglaciecola sp. G1-23]MCF2946938.1 transporter substrate-binding domain-containing protein [Paraglaciecola sp. G1-23]